MKQYLNLIRQITWSFYYKTGMEREELFSEACLAYCEAMSTYAPAKSKESTWITIRIKQHLTNLWIRSTQKKRLGRRQEVSIDCYYDTRPSCQQDSFFETLESLPENSKQLAKQILNGEIIEKDDMEKLRNDIIQTNQDPGFLKTRRTKYPNWFMKEPVPVEQLKEFLYNNK